LDAFLKLNRASNLAEFLDALQFIDVARRTSCTRTMREYRLRGQWRAADPRRLQANTINGSPPWFIRNGQGGNEWLPYSTRSLTRGCLSRFCRFRDAADS